MTPNRQSELPGQTWKVGALARATGLTVRTLHYYDEVGLLRPSARLAGGHRLYDAADVARLYRIIRLRQLSFPLSQIGQVLAQPEWQLAPAIERHLAEARRRAAMAAGLSARLAALTAELAQQHDPSPEQLFSTVEEMIMMDGIIRGTTGLLLYDDVDAAHDYIVRVYGLAPGRVWKSADGFTDYREVRAGEPIDQPYGIREYGASDPEGQIWWFQSPLG